MRIDKRLGSSSRKKKKYGVIFLRCCIVPLIVLSAKESLALPVFARKYHTACSTCHIAFPVRNGFGEAFRNNGYRFPDEADEEMVKEEPIKLGQEAYKDVFPNAIWPSDLPNMPSLGFLAKSGATMQKNPTPGDQGKPNKYSGNYKDVLINSEIDMFFSGTITRQLSYIGDLAFDGGTNGQAATPTTLGRLQFVWTFKPGLSMAWGTVGFPEQFDLISARAGTDLNGYAASLPNPNRGVELRIAGNTGSMGGYSLLAGIGRNSEAGSSDAVSGNIGDTRFVRATYKIGGNGLMSGVGGTYGVQAFGLDNSVTFGINYVNSGQGVSTGSEDNIAGLTKTAYSGDVRVNYGTLRAVGQYARFNEVLMPDADGTNYGKRTALSLEADYWEFPWLFGVMRYEHLQDDLNGKIDKVISGIGALIRANFKIGIEYVAVTKTIGNDRSDIDPVRFSAFDTAGNSINLYTQVGF